ncbi:hypothetical protein [Brevibacillus reuszeri]|uniref:hypothetical protein n=1 Tax=Brevibacillus reuszeri TaxID=54915 RepID=UPI001144770B|nr:hypothetical protein [Brevibacillus reuszeri]MED1861818.1 hypothetical protein [Brevibacillus reuszeri]
MTEKEIRILHQEKHDDVLEVTFSIQNLEDRLIIGEQALEIAILRDLIKKKNPHLLTKLK